MKNTLEKKKKYCHASFFLTLFRDPNRNMFVRASQLFFHNLSSGKRVRFRQFAPLTEKNGLSAVGIRLRAFRAGYSITVGFFSFLSFSFFFFFSFIPILNTAAAVFFFFPFTIPPLSRWNGGEERVESQRRGWSYNNTGVGRSRTDRSSLLIRFALYFY